MKHFRWAIALLFVAFLQFAYADTLDALKVSFIFGPNQGGDNAGYSLVGPNMNLSGVSTACFASQFCFGAPAFLPGMSLTPSLSVDFQSSQGFVRIGGHTYFAPNDVTLFISSLTASSFRFPVGGNTPSTFVVTLPASFAVVSGQLSNGTFFNVNIPASKLVLTFDYFPAANGNPASYFFAEGKYLVTTPETGSVDLMAIGLAGIFIGLIQRKSGWRAVRSVPLQ